MRSLSPRKRKREQESCDKGEGDGSRFHENQLVLCFFFKRATTVNKRKKEIKNGEVISYTSLTHTPDKMQLVHFLRHTSAELAKVLPTITASSSISSNVFFVLGNEGGDMDSVVCSMYIAYLLHQITTTTTTQNNNAAVPAQKERNTTIQDRLLLISGHSSSSSPLSTTNAAEPLFVPLLNFPLEDFALRTDVVWLFQTFGLAPNLLRSAVPSSSAVGPSSTTSVDLARWFGPLNDIECPSSPSPTTEEGTCDVQRSSSSVSGVVLVDHNCPTLSQSFLRPHIVGIVDHHRDEQLALDVVPRMIETCGSAATLVEHYFHSCAVAVPQPEVLLAPIVVDTMNFDPAFGRTTPKDLASRDRLMAQCQWSSKDVQGLYDKLLAAKNDISSLTIPETLRRDYKSFSFPWWLDASSASSSTSSSPTVTTTLQVGISSVLMLDADVRALYGDGDDTNNDRKSAAASGWIHGLLQYRAARKLDCLLVMHAREDAAGHFTRQLTAVGPSDIVETLVHEFRQSQEGQTVGLTTILHKREWLLDDEPRLSEGVTEGRRGQFQYIALAQDNIKVSRKVLVPLLSSFMERRSRQKDQSQDTSSRL